MVPNGWKRVPIKEVCHSIIDCVNKTAPVVDYETPYKMIRTSNVRNGRVNTFDVRYVTKETYEQWTRRGAPLKGDVILTREAPVGEVGILENAEGIFLGQRLMMYRANKKIADNYYLFYSLSSAFCQKQIEDYSNGGTVAHMRVPDCGELLVNLPPLLEQQKIAQILLTWDQAISATEKLLENSQRQKHALMQELLMKKTRLFDENGNRFSTEWRSISLNQICEFIKDGTHGTHVRYESGIPMLSATNITKDGRIDFKDVPFISEEDYLKIHSKYQISKGDLLLSVVGTIGRVAVVKEDCKFTLQRSVAILRPKKNICVEFIEQVLSTPYFRSMLHRRSNSTAQAGIYLGELSKININLPELVEQKKIAEVLALADKQTAIIKTNVKQLKQEKKALMQQLLTGKKRVKVAA